MLRNGFLGVFLNLKTIDYLFFEAYYNIKEEPWPEPKPFLTNSGAGAVLYF